jgi:murein DD-endopeptidase MepM/ murein hydrolase activator NlpD
VRTGQVLAAVGRTGTASAPHLHFEIWRGRWYKGGEPIDPLPYLAVWDAIS